MNRRGVLVVCAVGAMTAALTAAASGQPARTVAAPDFDATLRLVEAAQVELVRGRAAAFKDLWSHGEDVTLIGGLGGDIEKGWSNVGARLDGVSTQYAEGSRKHEEVSRHVAGDLAYVVQRETIQFRRPGNGEHVVQPLRVSMVFRREAGRWRLVHRHADSLTARAAGR